MGRRRKMSNDKSSGLSEDNIPPIQDMVQQNEDTHSGMLSSSFEKKVRPFLDLIDDLRAVGVEKDVALPTVAVIGDQSSGKSSVLESLSGVQLPRGTGIVTRCPLALKLKRGGSKWKCTMKYNTAEGPLQEDITAPSDVGEAVREAQRMLAGFQKGISKELITLEVESSSTPDLTLIDLPGIARVAVEGQPPDIEKKIKELILSYIEQKETIILVAIPCNVDIATTEALSMAQQCDPNGERTVGVLTKPDLMDPGTEFGAIKVLNNESIVLKKGYIMVKCRSQRDIERKITLEEAIEAEKSFFETHSVFKSIEEKSTTPVLANKLTTELVEQINHLLPGLRKEVNRKFDETNEELNKLPCAVPTEKKSRFFFLNGLIMKYTTDLRSSALGDYHRNFKENVMMYAKARRRFAKWLRIVKQHEETFNVDLYDNIKIFMTKNTGRELPGFVSYHVFENLAREHIAKLETPALNILKEVADIVPSVADTLADEDLGFLPELAKSVKMTLEELKEKQYEEAKTLIQKIFKMESQIYTQDVLYSNYLDNEESEEPKETPPSSFRKAVAINPLFSPMNLFNGDVNSVKYHKDIEVMSKHLTAYVKIAQTRLCDHIPMVIRHHLLHEFSKQLQLELSVLIQERNIEELVQEHREFADHRKHLYAKAKRLDGARRILLSFC
uniref:interferon-induced GTP-binding protein Mx-like n=1 Tax=Myxine glutinosa TaxID=7769 RepID=UPI00358EE8FF